MADKKVLPVEYPKITSWQWHATLFSILGDDENFKKWVYSNYIQLRCYHITEIFTGDDMLFADIMPGSSSLKECPYIITSLMTKNQIDSYCDGDVLDFIIKTIDMGGYVYGVFDEAKILCDVELDYKFPHELFIYGYDKEKKIFNVGDFTFNEKYAHTTVTFEEVERGYNVIAPKDDHMFKDDYKGVRGLYVIWKNNETPYYELDKMLVIRTLHEYLECQDTKDHFRMMRNRFNDTIFGIDVYDSVLEQVEKQVESGDFDIRATHIMYDHKVLMYDRIKYLMEKGLLKQNQELLDKYAEVVDNVLASRNLVIRISITGDTSVKDRFKGYFDEAKTREIEVLTKVLAELEG